MKDKLKKWKPCREAMGAVGGNAEAIKMVIECLTDLELENAKLKKRIFDIEQRIQECGA